MITIIARVLTLFSAMTGLYPHCPFNYNVFTRVILSPKICYKVCVFFCLILTGWEEGRVGCCSKWHCLDKGDKVRLPWQEHRTTPRLIKNKLRWSCRPLSCSKIKSEKFSASCSALGILLNTFVRKFGFFQYHLFLGISFHL